MAAFTTTNLLDSAIRRSFLPSGQLTFTTEEMLAIGDEEMMSRILPNIMAVREEFFVFPYDTAIAASTGAINIHARSVGMIVREVQIIDSNNAVTDLPRIEPEQVDSYAEGSVDSFYLRGNQIILHRTPSQALGTLRQSIFLRPGNMIQTTSAGVISNINSGTGAVTVTTIPSTWATGNIFDFIKQDGAHEYLSIDNTSTDVTSNVITFSSLPSTLRVGDYVSLSGESPLVQLPPDYRPVLAQLMAAEFLDAMNQPGAEKAKARAEKMLEAAQKSITPRVQGEDRVVQPINWF